MSNFIEQIARLVVKYARKREQPRFYVPRNSLAYNDIVSTPPLYKLALLIFLRLPIHVRKE